MVVNKKNTINWGKFFQDSDAEQGLIAFVEGVGLNNAFANANTEAKNQARVLKRTGAQKARNLARKALRRRGFNIDSEGFVY